MDIIILRHHVADVIETSSSPIWFHIFIGLPIVLTAIMYNNGVLSSLSLATIVALLSQGKSYLIGLTTLLGFIQAVITQGGLTIDEVIHLLQYLDPLTRTLEGVVNSMTYFIRFLQAVGFQAHAHEAIVLHTNLINTYNSFVAIAIELRGILQNLQQLPN